MFHQVHAIMSGATLHIILSGMKSLAALQRDDVAFDKFDAELQSDLMTEAVMTVALWDICTDCNLSHTVANVAVDFKQELKPADIDAAEYKQVRKNALGLIISRTIMMKLKGQ